jgi:hypothetical protein
MTGDLDQVDQVRKEEESRVEQVHREGIYQNHAKE